MEILELSNNWPVWANAPIVLFHGTLRTSAQNITDAGVDLAYSEENADFGRGFYTTTSLNQAKIFSERQAFKFQGVPAIVRLTFNRKTLASLRTIAFVRGSLDAVDFWSFIINCRNGLFHDPQSKQNFDVAYGPVAKMWRGPSNSSLWEGYDQISFHTVAAVAALNDPGLCLMEVI